MLTLIDKSDAAFKAKAVQPTEIAEVTPMSVEGGKSFVVESPLEDKNNENSCILTSFECGIVPDRASNRLHLLNQVLMNYI